MKKNDDAFQWAAKYAFMGWRVVVNYGVDANGVCACFKGEKCRSPGKHPVGEEWQTNATTDEEVIYEKLDVGGKRNIGVQNGPLSGVIDIEFDNEQGRETASRYKLETIDTPTFTSKRSTHRVFRWNSRLPNCAVIKIDELEIRIGGGEKGNQSVFPPSTHASGVSYSWVNGMTPDDCEPADIPEPLMQRILEEAEKTGGTGKPRGNDILKGGVSEGGRHDHLLQHANAWAMKANDIHDPVEQQALFCQLLGANIQYCNPPKSEGEIEAIWRDAVAWAKRKQGESKAGANLSVNGLEYRDGEWWPGEWTLKVIHGDPVTYVVTLPVHRDDLRETRRIGVTLNAEQYRSASKVAEAILEATHTVVVDANPDEWTVIWNGRGKRRGQEAVIGMKAKLMDIKIDEAATAENCRYAAVAGWFLDALSMCPRPDVNDEDAEPGQPDIQGMPSWVRNRDGIWELWFSWTRAWEIANSGKRGIVDVEKLRLKRSLLERTGEKKFVIGRAEGEGGMVRRFVRFGVRHLESLEAIASGEEEVKTSSSYTPEAADAETAL